MDFTNLVLAASAILIIPLCVNVSAGHKYQSRRWNPWSPWSVCSSTCRGGAQARGRSCNSGVTSECPGQSYEVTECNLGPCSVWNPWSPWSICSYTCGEGLRARGRSCESGVLSDCDGQHFEIQNCTLGTCSVWNEWSPWWACSHSCGGGFQTRDRMCNTGVNSDCNGLSYDSRECNAISCSGSPYISIPALTTESTGTVEWSPCTKTCGTGVQYKRRRCDVKTSVTHGNNCTGHDTEEQHCNTNLCPVDGLWNSWSTWSICTNTCGGGQQNRTRQCIYSAQFPHGAPCSGNSSETEICNSNLCPVNGVWSSWSKWSICTTTCGGGRHDRTRQCIYSAQFPHGAPCIGNSSETEICSNNLCPVDGYWNSWSNWSICTTTCGGGQHNRTRQCMYSDQFPHGASCSGNSSEREICNDNLCPVDGVWSSWYTWSICTTTCGGGHHNRTRQCIYSAKFPHGAPCSGNASATEICNNNLCPVDGYWNSWSNWSICTTTCGGGHHNRTRQCIYSAKFHHGAPCSGNASETEICNNNLCPVDGYWNSWSNWSICTTTCGGGHHNRTRQCIYSAQFLHGAPCSGTSSETEICNDSLCPVNGVWSSWSEWSICTTTCGGGHHNRTRQCIYSAKSPHGAPCSGNSSETEICNNNLCPVDGYWNSWSKWSICTTTCGGGKHDRTRQCIYSNQFPHGMPCIGNSSETEICNNNLCPVDGLWNAWSGWSICTTTCGGGHQNRTRHCTYSAQFPHGAPCIGNSSESVTCNTNLCPVDGLWNSWSEWSNCTTTCGDGQQTRIRHCIYSAQFPHGAPCSGNSSETKICTNLCPVTCATCGDYPIILCEAIYRVNTACPEPYCVNILVNNALGDRSLERRCGTLKECKEDWWQKSSLLDKCTSFDQRLTYKEAFNCTFCCTTPNCNGDIKPRAASMYKQT